MTPFSCIILAGGRSSRMGTDKATLLAPTQVDLLTYMVHQAELAGASEVIISRSPAATPAHLRHYQIMPDRTAGQGPLGGLLSCLSVCHYGRALVMPVDMPALAPHYLTTLAQAAEPLEAVHYQNYELPCVLPVNQTVIDFLEQELSNPNARRSIRGLLAHLQAREIALPMSSARYFMNTNTPDDWQQFIQGYGI